ncbi:MAG: ectoine hydroxylase [Gammaproteobacteria bacterium]|nr:ectoine hydroxylase [Gammaproteobacteria bacterium]MBK81111.1 ectoine hydroxylase [Gammaproteobacteria bacterium]
MPEAFDHYPTRLPERHGPVPRREPVIHADPADRRRGPLDADQLARFERDGFLVLEGFFQPREIERFRDDLAAYEHDPEMLARPGTITEPDSDAIRSIFGIHALSARFDTLTRDSRLLDLSRQILGSDVYVHQSRLNRKPAFRGRGFDWHSDFETWHAEDGMPAMRCVSISVSLSENRDDNGPLMLVPGSHETFYPTVGETPKRNWETSLKRQKVGVPALADIAAATRNRGVVAARGGPGTVTVFDGNTLHASSDNLSPAPRTNLFFVYNSIDNRLRAPYAASGPRPEWLASRERVAVLEPGPAQRSAVA